MRMQTILHSPTLESVEMVEKTIKEHSGELGTYQLWKVLPRKMMYQTFQTILDYLLDTNKILIKDGKIIWIWDPEAVSRILRSYRNVLIVGLQSYLSIIRY